MAKNISDIQFEGTNDVFVQRSSETDFDTGSKLTVYESQEALFYFNGACAGVLGPGSHILETEHIPFLRGLLQKITGRKSIFHAQVYFVNKVELDLKWGAIDIVYHDPAGPVFNIGCRGQVNLHADNSRKIVEKLVGTQASLSKSKVTDYFKDLISAEVSDKLVNTMLENNISIIDLSSKLLTISKLLSPVISELFEGYGFSVEQFRIQGAQVPEDDPEYTRLKRLRADQGLMQSEQLLLQQQELIKQQTAAQKIKMEAEAMAYKRNIEGYDYATEKQFEFLNNIATNENAAAGISSDMLQMGAGLGMIGAVGGMMQNMTSPFANAMANMANPQPVAPAVHVSAAPVVPAAVPSTPAPNADADVPEPVRDIAASEEATTVESADESSDKPILQEDPVEVLKKLKAMADMGLIEQSEYDTKKKEILSRM